MSECNCPEISCCETGEFSSFTYSLVNGQSYLNDEMTFQIPCPPGYNCTGPSAFVRLPPGSIRFTPTVFTPNPPTWGDPWTPEGGNYQFTCGTQVLNVLVGSAGFTNAQIIQIVNFLTSCVAIKESIPQLAPVPKPFLNQAVYFVHVCGENEALQYTGTLPSWIQLDTANSRLVVPVGKFPGVTQVAANLAAQTALDSFGNAAVTAGTLFCQAAACCLPFIAQTFTVTSYAPGNFDTVQSGGPSSIAGSAPITIVDLGDPQFVLGGYGGGATGYINALGVWRFWAAQASFNIPRIQGACFGDWPGGSYGSLSDTVYNLGNLTTYLFPAWDGVFEVLPDSGNCCSEILSADVGCVVGPPDLENIGGVRFILFCSVVGLNVTWTARFTDTSGAIILWEGQLANASPDGVFPRTAGLSAIPASITIA